MVVVVVGAVVAVVVVCVYVCMYACVYVCILLGTPQSHRCQQQKLARTRPCEESQCLHRTARATKQHIYDDAKPSPERFANVVQALAVAALPAAPAAAAMPELLAAVAHSALTHFGSHP